MRHEMLTQRTFLPSRAIQKRYAESAFCDRMSYLLWNSRRIVQTQSREHGPVFAELHPHLNIFLAKMTGRI